MSDKHWLFSSNPAMISCASLSASFLLRTSPVTIVLATGKSTTGTELIRFFNMQHDRIPSQSAFVQRRNQISLSAFRYLFDEFSASFPQTTHKFKDHVSLAADGCHVVYATNEMIIEDYNVPRMIDHRGYNHMHLNGFVDVISKAFLDIVIQPGQQPDERAALHSMLDNFEPDNPESYIITADRGYESYDLIFHCVLRNFSYVFRVKAPSSPKSILSSYCKELPDDQDEFDVTIRRFFTDKYTNIMKKQSTVYHYMNPNKNIPHFKPLLDSSNLAYLSFRVLKLKVDENSYEYVITNLPFSFDLEDIKACYHWRWGAEISFRYLKHAAGLLYFHSRKPDFLKQEIYASLVIYNFGIFLANKASEENKRKNRRPDNKYRYEVDFSTALSIARDYFLRPPEDDINIIKILTRFVHAVKEPFRKFKRPLRGIGAIHFNYR